MALDPLVAVDPPDHQAVDQNVVRRVLACHRLGQRHARRPADGRWPAFRRCRFGAGIQRVDDPAPFLFLHMRNAEATEADVREQLQGDVVLPIFVGKLHEGRAFRGADIVHQDVDRAEVFDRRGMRRLDLRFLQYIARIGADGAACGVFDLFLRFVEHVLPPRHNRNFRAGFGEHHCHGFAEPEAAARDKCCASV